MYTFAHYVYPKSVPSFCTMDLYTLHILCKSVPSFSNLEPNVSEVTILFKMYTLHILCTQKVCLLSTTMYSQR